MNTNLNSKHLSWEKKVPFLLIS